MTYLISALVALAVSVGGYLGFSPEPFNLGGGLTTFQGGTGTTSPSGILYGDETIRLKTLSIGSGLSFSSGTLSATGGGGSGTGNVSTSTSETAGQLAYWTSTGATPATLGQVATTTLTASSPLSLSNAISVLGSSASALSLDTSGTWTGNAGTASALAANGANCSVGNYPLGVDASGAVENCTADANTQLTEEQVDDFVGGMFTSNTETLITATYQDADGTIDLVVDNDLANYSNANSAFFDAIGDFTGTLTDTKFCTYDSANGEIDCESEGGSGGGGNISGWATTTSQVSGQLVLYPTNATDILTIGSSATTSAEFYADPNTVEFVLNGSTGTSSTLWGAINNEWIAGTFTGNTDFLFASSTGQLDGILDAQKVWSADKGTNGFTIWQGLTVTDDITLGGDTIDEFVGDGLALSTGDLIFDCSDVVGTGLSCSGENLTLNATGDWTGTFDGQQGSFYLDGENITTDTIDDDSIDFADVTLADLTFDVGSVSTTEFGFLNGVTSAIQTQLDALGEIAGQIWTGIHDFTGATVKQQHYPAITWPGTATTTTATTTVPIGTAGTAQQFNWADCRVTSGTGGIVLTDGTNDTNYIAASTTEAQFSFTTNNTFTQGERREVEIGPLTNAMISCTVNYEDS